MLRVIDLTTLSGAYAARLFAEEGHEVIRVEASEGDELRRLAASYHTSSVSPTISNEPVSLPVVVS